MVVLKNWVASYGGCLCDNWIPSFLVEHILFWKNPWNFSFFNFTPGNSRQSKALPLEIQQNCGRSLGNSKAKNQDPWKFPHYFFSRSAFGKSTLFLINRWEFHMLFHWYPWKFHMLNPPLFVFFWKSPFLRQVKAHWWRQWAKNKMSANQNSRNRWCQIVRWTIWWAWTFIDTCWTLQYVSERALFSRWLEGLMEC